MQIPIEFLTFYTDAVYIRTACARYQNGMTIAQSE